MSDRAYWARQDEHGLDVPTILGPVNDMRPPVVAVDQLAAMLAERAAVNDALDAEDEARAAAVSDLEMIAGHDCRLMLRAIDMMSRVVGWQQSTTLLDIKLAVDQRYGDALRKTTEVQPVTDLHF